MAHKNSNICGGFLVSKSESGEPNLEKVLVETKPGNTRSRIKCRIQKFAKANAWPSKISTLIMPRRRKSESDGSSVKSLQSSIECVHKNSSEENKQCLIDTSGDSEPQQGKTESDDFTVSVSKIDFYEKEIKSHDLTVSTSENSGDYKKKNSDADTNTEERSSIMDKETIMLQNVNTETMQYTLRSDTSSIDADIVSSVLNVEPEITFDTIYISDLTSTSEDELYHDEYSTFENIDPEAGPSSESHITYADYQFDDEFPYYLEQEENNIYREHNALVMTEQPLEKDKIFEYYESSKEDTPKSVDECIDSGLRRLRSGEPCLRLDPVAYQSKRKLPGEQKQGDNVKPILTELSSDLFQPPSIAPRPEKNNETVDSTPLEESEDGSDEVEEEPKVIREPQVIKRLKNLEGKRFKIDPKEFLGGEIHDLTFPATITPRTSNNSFTESLLEKPDAVGDFHKDTDKKEEKKIPNVIFPSEESTYSIGTTTSSLLLTAEVKPSRSFHSQNVSNSKSQGFSSTSLNDNKEARGEKYSKSEQFSKN